MTYVIIGLGSNMGNREGYLSQAVNKLDGLLENRRASGIYESAPMLPENAPDEWDTAFLNMVVSGETELSVYALLDAVKSIEHQLGRRRTKRWGPREIDIDILVYGSAVIDDERVNIPHPGILERAFVLQPICEIAPDLIYPRPGIFYHKTMCDIAGILHMSEDTGCKPYHSKSEVFS